MKPLWPKHLSLSLTAALALAACAPAAPTTPADSGRLQVVATFSILGDLVKNVAGDQADVLVLVGPDGDAHSYEPTPGDIRALADAGLIIATGLEFESWLDDLYAASGSTAARVAAADGITLLEAGAHAGEAAHGEYDPHIWQSALNAIPMVKNIQAALAAADPANAAVYRANADAYLNQLNALQEYIAGQVAGLPPERRKLVTNHDTFAYFAQAYGFTILGDALGGASTEGGEPSAAQVAQLADRIRAEGVPALFAENVEGSQVVQRLARETGVKVGPPLYTDALGPPGSAGDTYLKMMRYNVDSIVGALR